MINYHGPRFWSFSLLLLLLDTKMWFSIKETIPMEICVKWALNVLVTWVFWKKGEAFFFLLRGPSFIQSLKPSWIYRLRCSNWRPRPCKLFIVGALSEQIAVFWKLSVHKWPEKIYILLDFKCKWHLFAVRVCSRMQTRELVRMGFPKNHLTNLWNLVLSLLLCLCFFLFFIFQSLSYFSADTQRDEE